MSKSRKIPSAQSMGTASTAVDAAISIVSQVAGLLPTHRQCSIEIKNKCSNYTLSDPSDYIFSGFCEDSLPLTIDPSSDGSALFSKTAHAARGAVGVFTYDLLHNSKRKATEKLAVMFSVPYDFNLYSNWYAVGIFDKSKECDYDLYYQMYYDTDSMFVRSNANGTCLNHRSNRVTVTASMTDSYQPVMKVEVKEN